MCVANVYVDMYPDGKMVEFRQTQYCPYGHLGMPCQKLSTVENPIRQINFGEPTSEYMMNTYQRAYTEIAPRSSEGLQHQPSHRDLCPEEGRRHQTRRHSDLYPRTQIRQSRHHQKERIIIVDSPTTPRKSHQPHNQACIAPSSPGTQSLVDGMVRGRPMSVDKRLPHRSRIPSVGAVIGDRPRCARSQSRNHVTWESLPSSHDSCSRREAEESEHQRGLEKHERLGTARYFEHRARDKDTEIHNRIPLPVPVPPAPLGRKLSLRPVVDQAQLQRSLGSRACRNEQEMTGERALAEAAVIRRCLDERDREIKARREVQEKEAMIRKFKEQQVLPSRRVSIGPATRRHRVLYDDGVYRYE